MGGVALLKMTLKRIVLNDGEKNSKNVNSRFEFFGNS